MFAFAFYNKQEKSLYLARDRVGERFYTGALSKIVLSLVQKLKALQRLKVLLQSQI